MQAPHDAIVVLGAALRDDGAPSPALVRRLRHGVRLLGLGCAGTLLLSGGKPRGGVTEAAAMAALAGAADAAILTEEDSVDTWENAIFSARLLLARRQRRVVVVSDAYHLPRAVLCFRAAGLTAVGSAAPGGLAGAPAAYLAAALRETAAFAGYAVKGRFRVNP